METSVYDEPTLSTVKIGSISETSPKKSADTPNKKIAFLCNPCIDITIQNEVSEDLLKKLKFVNGEGKPIINTLFGKNELVKILQEFLEKEATKVTRRPAGSLRNTAVTMQMLREKSDDLMIIGPYSLSDTDYEDVCKKDLINRKIEYIPLDKGKTKIVESKIITVYCMSCTIDGKSDRYMLSNTMVYPKEVVKLPDNIGQLIIEGYAYCGNEDVFNDIINKAFEKNITIGFALSAESIALDKRDQILKLIEEEKIKEIYCNSEELFALMYGHKKYAKTGLEETTEQRQSTETIKLIDLQKFAKDNKVNILETMGDKGARFINDSGIVAKVAAETFSGETPPNTLGAGDTFLAGFLSGRTQGLDIFECLRLGASAAAEVLKVKTATINEAAAEKVMKDFQEKSTKEPKGKFTKKLESDKNNNPQICTSNLK